MKLEDVVSMFFADEGRPETWMREIEALEQEQVKIAIIGRSGTGKSSLINALYGEKVARTGVTETTAEIKEYSVSGLILVDVPGAGTQKFPRETYFETMQLERFDAFVLVTAKRVYEDDLFLVKEIREKTGKHVKIVRSMIDQDVDNAKRDGISSQETTDVIRSDLKSSFPEADQFFLISSFAPERFDFGKFEESIFDDLTERKRDKFVYSAQAYTREALDRKRKVARKHVMFYAGLAAANGFNPIIGVDIAADLGILTRLTQWVLKCYKFEEANQSRWQGPSEEESRIRAIFTEMLALGTREMIIVGLRRGAARLASKQMAKWVPMVGNVVSAGVGFGFATWFGSDLIDKCEKSVWDIILAQAREQVGRARRENSDTESPRAHPKSGKTPSEPTAPVR